MLMTALTTPARREREPRLKVVLATSAEQVREAQALRYRIFYEELGAPATAAARLRRLDIDPFDAVCDHLLVIDEAARPGEQIVGTYRLLRERVADAHGGFYSSGEFDLAPLRAHARTNGGQLLELGRSCVAPAYRSAGTIALLWRGIADYLRRHDIGHMFGCASFHGTDPRAHAATFAYLHAHHLAPPHLRVSPAAAAGPWLRDFADTPFDADAALRALPPLIRGYLRVGAVIGDGVYVDHAFNTVDLFITMPVDAIAGRYRGRFGAPAAPAGLAA